MKRNRDLEDQRPLTLNFYLPLITLLPTRFVLYASAARIPKNATGEHETFSFYCFPSHIRITFINYCTTVIETLAKFLSF